MSNLSDRAWLIIAIALGILAGCLLLELREYRRKKRGKADRVRAALANHGAPMTNSQVMHATGLGSQDISVTLFSLRKQEQVTKDETAFPATWSLA